MTVTLNLDADGRSQPLDRAVLALLHRLVLAESDSDSVTGCMVHPTGKIKWLGGTWKAKQVVWEFTHGPLAAGRMLVRTCRTDGCIAAEPMHHVAQSRQEFGAWLGSGVGWRPRSTT